VQGGGDATGTTCGAMLFENDVCEAVCPNGIAPVGVFVCIVGRLRHSSLCVAAATAGQVTQVVVDKVVGSMQIDTTTCPPEADIKAALSRGMNISTNNIAWTLCYAGGRRLVDQALQQAPLRRMQTSTFNIDYEMSTTSTSSITVADLQSRVLLLVASNTAQQTAFIAELVTLGNPAPQAIMQLYAPQILLNQSTVMVPGGGLAGRNYVVPTQAPQDESSDNPLIAGLVIGGTAIVGFGSCCAWLILGKKREAARAAQAEERNNDPEGAGPPGGRGTA